MTIPILLESFFDEKKTSKTINRRKYCKKGQVGKAGEMSERELKSGRFFFAQILTHSQLHLFYFSRKKKYFKMRRERGKSEPRRKTKATQNSEEKTSTTKIASSAVFFFFSRNKNG